MAEKFKCLNPVGIQDPINLRPLAPRLDKIDGKTIYVTINAGGDQDITIPFVKRLQSDYPNINWQIRRISREDRPFYRRVPRTLERGHPFAQNEVRR